MSPDPAGRRSPRGPARGVAAVRPAVPPPEPTGTVYASGGYLAGEVRPSAVARLVLAAALMVTGMVGGGLLAGQAVATWLGV